MAVGLLYDDLFLEHFSTARPHPECPERLVAVQQALASANLWDRVHQRRPRPATDQELGRIHQPRYLERLHSQLPGRAGNLDPDTFYAPRSLEAALAAAGGTIDLAQDVLLGKDGLHRGLCLVRPPGHHAEADRGMGFCLLNNIALAAAAARQAGARRVAILDWDIHHGNGTQHAFYDRDDVLFLSSHRYPFYPGTGWLDEIGRGAGAGYTVNAPLASGLRDADFIALFDELFIPIIEQYQPDLILISAGFDAHESDPIGDLRITDQGFRAASRRLCRLADRLCDGRLVAVLEGGYNVAALGRNCVALLEEMLADPDASAPLPSPGRRQAYTGALLEEVNKALQQYWDI